MQLFDTIALDEHRLTRDGYLVCEARAARTGIYRYRGIEVGVPDKEYVRVYRPPDEVFNRDAMESFTSLPVTLDHPPEMVDAGNWRKYARGFTGEDILEDKGEGGPRYVRVPIILKDQEAIDAVTKGTRELSFGYTCDFDMTPGKTEDGEKYDAVQRKLRGNHLAIVAKGRAGPNCRMGDENGDETMNLKTITQDGIPLEVTDAGATVIATLNQRVSDANSKNLQLVSDHAAELKRKDDEIAALKTTIGDKDKELGTKDGEITKLKADAMTPAQLDTLIAERAAVIADASLIAPDADFKGKAANDVRRVAVTVVAGADKVKDKSDDYVSALFDSFVETAKSGGGNNNTRDPIQDSMSSRVSNVPKSATAAHNKMISDMTAAWQSPSGRA